MKKNNLHGKFFGTTTVGERGQIVIPVNVRKKLNLSKGDKLLVISPRDNMVTFIKIDKIKTFVESFYKDMKEFLSNDDNK